MGRDDAPRTLTIGDDLHRRLAMYKATRRGVTMRGVVEEAVEKMLSEEKGVPKGEKKLTLVGEPRRIDLIKEIAMIVLAGGEDTYDIGVDLCNLLTKYTPPVVKP